MDRADASASELPLHLLRRIHTARDIDARALFRANILLAPSVLAGVLMILWAAHDGGYDSDTWYWGALLLLGLLVALIGARPGLVSRIPPALKLALVAFGLYVAWSYLSILWSSYAGDALTGSNRAFMYWLVFALFAVTPWRGRQALWMLVAYAVGLGVIGFLILKAMATTGHFTTLFGEGRLVSPTGYFNSTTALFTMGAFLGVALAERRELPTVLRGVLLAIACSSLELALLGQSRGWLFTLPFMLAGALLVVRTRLRIVLLALIPTVATLVVLKPLLDVFRASNAAHPTAASLSHAAEHAGRAGLLAAAASLLLGTILAAGESRVEQPAISVGVRRLIGATAVVSAIAIATVGASAATHGHPVSFLKRQWHGFAHPSTPGQSATASHFATIGTGRYDAWRVAFDAAISNPVGGLGQDNFGDYYYLHRRTSLELQWTHSIELRLLAHTGVVGAVLFLVFLGSAVAAAVRGRGGAPALVAAVGGAAMLPLSVWLVHGSVDWFWEMPALTGPAVGFLALAGRVRDPERATAAKELQREQTDPEFWRRIPRPAAIAGAAIAVVAAAVVLGFPYLSVRNLSSASDLRGTDPIAAINLLGRAAKLNPLDADAPRLAGLIALQSGHPVVAEQRFTQARERQPGGWFAWLGAGLAASVVGDVGPARQDYIKALSINKRQPAVKAALARVNSTRPLTPNQALAMLVLAH